MSLENPFSPKPILPPEQTDPEANEHLIASLLGEASSVAWKKTVSGAPTQPPIRKPLFDLASFDEKTFEKHDQVEAREAETLFGKRFIGPDQIEATFGFTIERKDLPPLPFSKQELREAQARGDFLIYNCSHTPEGKPLTLETMARLSGGNKPTKDKDGHDVYPFYRDQFNEAGNIKNDAWFKQDPLIMNATPEAGWQLVSPAILEGSTSQNYLDQTDFLIDHMRGDSDFPQGSQEQKAETEWQEKKPDIRKLLDDNKIKEASTLLSSLHVSTLFREPLGNTVFRYLVSLQARGERLFNDGKYTWSNTVASNGRLARFGGAGRDGASVGGCVPRDDWSNGGAVSSRRRI